MSTLYHFSENDAIEVFEPHVPATNPGQQPAVWAIDEAHAPLYWFPRDCPRGAVWANDVDEVRRMCEVFLTTARRLHVAELVWFDRIRSTELFEYVFDAGDFERWDEAEGQWISTSTVYPTAVRPVGDLLDRHVEADIELRFTPNIGPFWDQVVESNLPFSGVRLSNAGS